MSQSNSTALIPHAAPSTLGRRAGTPNLPGQPQLQRSRGITPPNPSRPPKQTTHHLNRADIPSEATGFKAALELHLRILMGAMTNTSVPEDPTVHVMHSFEQRYTSAEEVERLLRGNTDHYANADIAVLESLRRLRLQTAAAHGSQITALVSQVPEDELRRIFATLHMFGLPEWRPDLIGGSPTSIYNGALESIALWTFEKAMGRFAYRHLKPNGRFLRDGTLIQRLYNNFVWSYMRGLAIREKKGPGSVVQDLARNKIYKLRSELGARRLGQLQADGFNPRIQALVEEPECHSDSERREDGGSGFWIMHKRARNPHVTEFYRWVDERRTSMPLFRRQRSAARQEEPRERHPDNKETDISMRIPRKIPLDWFDPVFFNALPVDIRSHYRKSPIALPLAADIGNFDPSTADWKTMPEQDFMTKYGNKVRELYKFPTKEELRNFQGDDYVSSSDEMAAGGSGGSM